MIDVDGLRFDVRETARGRHRSYITIVDPDTGEETLFAYSQQSHATPEEAESELTDVVELIRKPVARRLVVAELNLKQKRITLDGYRERAIKRDERHREELAEAARARWVGFAATVLAFAAVCAAVVKLGVSW